MKKKKDRQFSTSKNWREIPANDYPFLKKLKRTKKRWKNQTIFYDEYSDRYYHKDPLHGEIEEYDFRGDHIGVLLPDGTKHPKKGKVAGRFIPI